MNCKPGILAIIKAPRTPLYDGRIAEVLYLAPHGDFTLPDGYPAVDNSLEDGWVIKFVGGPTTAPTTRGVRETWYAVGSDKYLFPLPGEPEEVKRHSETVFEQR